MTGLDVSTSPVERVQTVVNGLLVDRIVALEAALAEAVARAESHGLRAERLEIQRGVAHEITMRLRVMARDQERGSDVADGIKHLREVLDLAWDPYKVVAEAGA